MNIKESWYDEAKSIEALMKHVEGWLRDRYYYSDLFLFKTTIPKKKVMYLLEGMTAVREDVYGRLELSYRQATNTFAVRFVPTNEI